MLQVVALRALQELVKGHNIEVGQETAYEAFLGEVAATDSQPAVEISATNKCAGMMASRVTRFVCTPCQMQTACSLHKTLTI